MKARKLISNGVLYNARMFCTRRSFLWEENGAPGENPRVRVGDQPYPLAYNHCRSRGSNSGRIGEKPLRYPDTHFAANHYLALPNFTVLLIMCIDMQLRDVLNIM
jgi:hypothetical protein